MLTAIESSDRLREVIRQVYSDDRQPGLTVSVVSRDGVVFEHAEGYADIESQQPMTLGHRHCIGSVTKTMVALCVMALVDEGRLSLTDKVADLLPDVRFDGPVESMTVWHLLTHTSGIGEAPTRDSLAAEVAASDNMRWREREFIDAYPNGILVGALPGTIWAYANHGYALLGEMIRRLEHAELDDVMQRRIFKPLAMRDSDCVGGASPRLSTPYHRAPTAELAELIRRGGQAVDEEPTVDGVNIRGANVERRNKPTLATGGVQATMLDMQRYALALLRGGGGIVRPDTFAEMIGPQWCPDERLPGWGLGFYRSRDWGSPSFAHAGSTGNGWLTDLVVVPEQDAALLILQNVNGGDFAQGFSRIARAVFGQHDPTPTDTAIDWGTLASAPGVFEATGGPLLSFRIATSVGRVQLKRQGDELWLYSRRGVAKSGVRLMPVDSTDPTFLVALEPGERRRFLLTRDSAGRVQGIAFADQSLAHLVRTENVAPWA